MDLAEQVRILEAAQGNPALLALATVDLAHEALAAAERTSIKDALTAAAVPHWCDGELLAALLETTSEQGQKRIGQLRALTVVESFPARGKDAVNVHEAARRALREHLRVDDPVGWKRLSSRAHAQVSRHPDPHYRIEALYHLFAVDQSAAALACETLDRQFTVGARPEVRHALALALRELTEAGWLTGRAQIEALLVLLDLRNMRGEAGQIEEEARRVLDLARAASHPSGTGRAQCLLGDILHAKGHADQALAAYRQYLAIFQDLASTDVAHTDWQREVAVAQSKLGDMFQDQARHGEALRAIRESLVIFERLASSDPSNPGWQRSVGIAHAKIGDISLAKGDFDEALWAYQQYLAILEQVASTDPSNDNWQRELGIAHSRLGDTFTAQRRFEAALAAYREDLAVSERLVARDPANALWQREHGVAHGKVGNVLEALGNLDEALAAYRRSLGIAQQLVSADPFHAESRYLLGYTHDVIGDVSKKLARLDDAVDAYREAVSAFERLVSINAITVHWQRQLGLTHTKLAHVLRGLRRLEEALASYRAGTATLGRLAATEMLDSPAQRELAIAYNGMGQTHQLLGDPVSAQSSFQSAVDAMAKALAMAPDNVTWQADLRVLRSWLDPPD